MISKVSNRYSGGFLDLKFKIFGNTYSLIFLL
jgi:hypothetical protein